MLLVVGFSTATIPDTLVKVIDKYLAPLEIACAWEDKLYIEYQAPIATLAEVKELSHIFSREEAVAVISGVLQGWLTLCSSGLPLPPILDANIYLNAGGDVKLGNWVPTDESGDNFEAWLSKFLTWAVSESERDLLQPIILQPHMDIIKVCD